MGISRLIGLHHIARALIVCLGTTTAGTSWAQMAGPEKITQRTLTVHGTGKLSVKPDSVEIQIGVISEAPTAKAALATSNESMNRLFQIVKERGIAEKDIQTSQISMTPRTTREPEPRPGEEPKAFIPKIVGYQVDNQVSMRSRDIAKLGPLLDAVVEGGANQINGISFRVDDTRKLLAEARKRAMADAKATATLIAGEAGLVLLAPLTIDDHSGPPEFLFGGGMGGGMGGRGNARDTTQIAAGEQEIEAAVSITYEVKVP